MSTADLHNQPYRRPLLWRGVEPQRMNWLWALICELAEADAVEVVQALHAHGVAIDARQARRWLADLRSDQFFPLSITELERNVRALLALRQGGASALPSSAVAAAAELDAAQSASESARLSADEQAPEIDEAASEEAVVEAPVAGLDALREMAGE